MNRMGVNESACCNHDLDLLNAAQFHASTQLNTFLPATTFGLSIQDMAAVRWFHKTYEARMIQGAGYSEL